jgi:signal transduction histidine kinase
MRRILHLTRIAIFAAFPLFATAKTDSTRILLEKKLETAVTPKDRIDANYVLANHLAETDSVASERYFNDGYRIAKRQGDLVGQANFFYYRANRRYNLGRFAESEALCRKSLEIFAHTKDTIMTLHAIGMLFNSMDYQMKDIGVEQAYLDYFHRTAAIEVRGGRKVFIARGFIYGSLASYYTLKDNLKSREAYLKQYDCYRKVNSKPLLMSFHSSYAHFCFYLKDYPEAIHHARVAVELCRQMNQSDEFDYVLSSISLAEMLISQGEFVEAQSIFNEVVTVSTRMRQNLIDMKQKDYQLALARAIQEADRNLHIVYAVSSGLLMLMLYLYLRRHYRLKALRHEIALKEGMAMDLHDEVGTAITKTIFHTQDMLSSEQKPDPRLRQILESSLQINASFRDALWSADRRTDDLVNLVDRIIETSQQATEGAPFTLVVKKAPGLPKRMMKAHEKRNVLLIIRETLHNVIKHSNGDSIEISIFPEGAKVVFQIIDNGSSSVAEKLVYGLGQHSMRQRAKKMNGDIHIGPQAEGYAVRLAI